MELLNKEGETNTTSEGTEKYSLLNNEVGVCLVDLDENVGQITWGNQYFWNNCFKK